MPFVARKGDQDDLGYTITSDVADTVKVNGQPVALKDSLMDDGIPIVSDVVDTVKINGRPVAVKGSRTDYHPQDPKGVGTIITASDNVRIG